MSSLWGENHDIKSENFYKEVETIEKKYFHVFKDRINIITGEAPDELKYQFVLGYNRFAYTIGFHKETYVPRHIQLEVIEAFKSHFSSK